MANDTDEIKSVFEFHPCDTPRGMLYYNLSELTDEQKIRLNEHKLDTIRDNHQYLSDHPEIKIVTSMMLKAILRERPKVNVQEYLARYLSESWRDIKKEIDKCIADREFKSAMHRAMPSITSVVKGLHLEESYEYIEEELHSEDLTVPKSNPTEVCKSILDDLLENLTYVDKTEKPVTAVPAPVTDPKLRTYSDFSIESFIGFPARFYFEDRVGPYGGPEHEMEAPQEFELEIDQDLDSL